MIRIRLSAGAPLFATLLASCATQPRNTPAPIRTVAYRCEGGTTLIVGYGADWATFTDTHNRTIRLRQQVTGSGFDYRGSAQELRGKGDELRWIAADGTTRICGAGNATLAGTEWELVQFQSAEDFIGTIKPNDPSHYTMELMPDGHLAMQLDCDRAAGRWEAHPASQTDGQISFIAPVMTRAMCLGPSMDVRIARDLEFVTSYRLIGDTLNLALKADAESTPGGASRIEARSGRRVGAACPSPESILNDTRWSELVGSALRSSAQTTGSFRPRA